MSDTCSYRSSYTDSGDRGADTHEHNRAYHPDHAHDFIMHGPDSPYWWSKEPRCSVCGLAQRDDLAGQCV